MRDRDRKREIDRERRARIKAGTWDFPNGGAAEFAKAGAVVHSASIRRDRSPKSPHLLAKSEAFTSAPAPRPVSSAPARAVAPAPLRHVITPSATCVVSPAPVRATSTSSSPPSMVAIGGVPVVAWSIKATAILRRLTLPLSRRSRNGARILKPCWRH
jgi:hypothetical protein